MKKEIPPPFYLQQHEITKHKFTKLTQKPSTSESLQMAMNPYFMGGSSIIFDTPHMVFTGKLTILYTQ